MIIFPSNTPQTYTGRTLRLAAVYALCPNSIPVSGYIMGLRGVEPLTSRLSGSPVRKTAMSARVGFPLVRPARRFPIEGGTTPFSTSARTQRVHRKASASIASGGVQEVAALL